MKHATVRSSTQFYLRFNLPMVRSPGFGSNPCYYVALFRLAFTMPPPNGLSLQHKLTRWIVLQKARRHRINLLRLLVGTQFQGLFHSPPGVLFNFPSRYLSTFGQIEYLGLAHGRARFLPDFPCPAVLGMPLGCFGISHTWLSHFIASFFKLFCYSITIPH